MDEASNLGISSTPVPAAAELILALSLVKLYFSMAMSELIKLILLLSIDPSRDLLGENLRLCFKLDFYLYMRLLNS